MMFLLSWDTETQWNSKNKVYRWGGDKDSWEAGEGLTEVPSDIPGEAVEVDLEYNQIEVIREGNFSHLVSKCKELLLQYNKIGTIEIGAWDGLISLKQLDLGHNEIKVLPQGSFSHLSDCDGFSVPSHLCCCHIGLDYRGYRASNVL